MPTSSGSAIPFGYRRLTTYAGYAAENNAGAFRAGDRGSPRGSPSRVDRLSRVTALVEPCMFTRGLMRAAEMQGAELRHGTSST